MERTEADKILAEMESFRNRANTSPTTIGTPDWIIRMCEAIVADYAGYPDRMSWAHIQKEG